MGYDIVAGSVIIDTKSHMHRELIAGTIINHTSINFVLLLKLSFVF